MLTVMTKIKTMVLKDAVITNHQLAVVVPASYSWSEGNNAPSVRDPVVDEERMRPGHWLGSVLCVPFDVLTLTAG